MTSVSPPAPAAATAPAPAPARRPGFAGYLLAEWTKIRSVRSTVWTLIIFVVVSLGLTALFTWLTLHTLNSGGRGQAVPQDHADGRAAALSVTGLDAPRIGEIAAANRIVLHELTPRLASLEEAFIELTAGSVEYGAETPAAPPPASPSPFTATSTTATGSSQ